MGVFAQLKNVYFEGSTALNVKHRSFRKKKFTVVKNNKEIMLLIKNSGFEAAGDEEKLHFHLTASVTVKVLLHENEAGSFRRSKARFN